MYLCSDTKSGEERNMLDKKGNRIETKNNKNKMDEEKIINKKKKKQYNKCVPNKMPVAGSNPRPHA